MCDGAEVNREQGGNHEHRSKIIIHDRTHPSPFPDRSRNHRRRFGTELGRMRAHRCIVSRRRRRACYRRCDDLHRFGIRPDGKHPGEGRHLRHRDHFHQCRQAARDPDDRQLRTVAHSATGHPQPVPRRRCGDRRHNHELRTEGGNRRRAFTSGIERERSGEDRQGDRHRAGRPDRGRHRGCRRRADRTHRSRARASKRQNGRTVRRNGPPGRIILRLRRLDNRRGYHHGARRGNRGLSREVLLLPHPRQRRSGRRPLPREHAHVRRDVRRAHGLARHVCQRRLRRTQGRATVCTPRPTSRVSTA